jgi:hypothetical protein
VGQLLLCLTMRRKGGGTPMNHFFHHLLGYINTVITYVNDNIMLSKSGKPRLG